MPTVDKVRPKLRNLDDMFEKMNGAVSTESDKQHLGSDNSPFSVRMIPFDSMDDFNGHPFKLYDGERKADMIDSIRDKGILMPLLLRPKGVERYEILSGHNRKYGAIEAGLIDGPAIIKDGLSDDEAFMYVVETNLMQRSFTDMSHSEKAAVLSLQHSKLFSQGKRTDILNELKSLEEAHNNPDNTTFTQFGSKLRTNEKIAETYSLSRNTVARYLRIEQLTNPLKQRLDAGEIPFIFFALLKPNITDEERNYLDSALVNCYERFGITHDNHSLYQEDGSFKLMPVLKDLYEILRETPDTKNLSVVLSRFVTGSASRLGRHTNVDLDNKYIVMDISEMGKDLLPLGMFLALDYCWDKCKESRVQKKALMLDELWCLIGASSNPLAADYVLEIFKIIRGYGGSAVCATQDLNDFFALENGKYGKAIINNSRTKIVLPLEEDEAMRVKDVLGLSDEETMQIIRNKRGEGLLCAGHNRISVAFQSTRLEYDNITTSRQDLEAQIKKQ